MQLKEHDTYFKVFRIYAFTNAALTYTLVFFHRNCPSIVSDDMAKDYDVNKKKLGIFSSMYFYPYAVTQIFAGLLSDIFDPVLLIGISHIISSIGAFICGASNGITVGCIGRFLVGLGCGPTYVPICRFSTTWFHLKYYSNIMGILLAAGGIGGIIAQYPLAAFTDKYGWRPAFYGIGGLGFLLAILLLIFCRGTPEDRGYKPVNPNQTEENNQPIKEKLNVLCNNFKIVIKNFHFWLCCGYIFLKDGFFFDLSGMWGGPYLADVYQYSNSKKGITLVGISLGIIVASFIFPSLSVCLHTKKWLCVVLEAIGSTICLIFVIFGKDIPYGLLYVFFILIGATMNAIACIIFSLIREYYDPKLSGTSTGLSNFFAFVGTAVFQSISSEIISLEGSFKDEEDNEKFYEKGYRNGLWIIGVVSVGLSTIIISFVKDSNQKAEKDKEHIDNNVELEEQHQESSKKDGKINNEIYSQGFHPLSHSDKTHHI